MSIHADRRIIVENIYDKVTLPESLVVMDTSGWEHREGGTETGLATWTRVLFVENPENPDGDTIAVNFNVDFYPNSVEVCCVSLDGENLLVPAPY